MSFRSFARVAVFALVLAALVAAPGWAAKKNKGAKPAPTKAAEPAKGEGAKAADPAKPADPAKADPAKPADPAKAEPAKPAAKGAASPDVIALWDAQCKKCHGADGRAQTGTGKAKKIEDMSTAAWQERFTDAQIRKVTVEGLDRDKDGVKQKMKGVKDATPAQIDGLVAYMRSFGR